MTALCPHARPRVLELRAGPVDAGAPRGAGVPATSAVVAVASQVVATRRRLAARLTELAVRVSAATRAARVAPLLAAGFAPGAALSAAGADPGVATCRVAALTTLVVPAAAAHSVEALEPELGTVVVAAAAVLKAVGRHTATAAQHLVRSTTAAAARAGRATRSAPRATRSGASAGRGLAARAAVRTAVGSAGRAARAVEIEPPVVVRAAVCRRCDQRRKCRRYRPELHFRRFP